MDVSNADKTGSLFHDFSLDYFHGCAQKTGRHPQFNPLFKAAILYSVSVMGLET